MKKKTTEEFIINAKIKHGETYDYSKVFYDGNKVKVENYKIKRFGVGPNISYSLGANGQLYPTFGIGLQYNVIRF